jgi:alpha-glucosidase
VADTPQPEADENWWRGAVIYQVYPRSFADSNGDGTGDLAGVRSRLPYLAELGVNALWFNPWYPSPMADGGYDVADYRDIDPVFGTLAEAEKLISEALALGIRTIIDIVPNHISAAHPWFREALAAGPGSAARERFWFRPGRGENGELPPNNWPSQFGGPAWTRTTGPDGAPGDWFLNLFDSEQPDLNWNHPDVRAEHEDVLRFWFDRGAGGVRIDSAALVTKDPALPDLSEDPAAPHPYVDRDDLHEIYRGWRRIADSYSPSLRQGGPPARILVGEVWMPDAERFARYLRPDEMHTAFNFDFLSCPWEPARLRASIDTTLAAHEPVGAPATWVLCNHDVTRTVTRYGRSDTASTSPRRPSARPPTWNWAPAGRGRRRCSPWRCPARCTSTRARSWGCPRSRTFRRTGCRTRCTCGPAAPTRAATAAGCRCRGRATARPTASARRAPPSRGCRSRPTGRPAPPRSSPPTPRPCSPSTGRRCGCAPRNPASATAR